MVNYSSRQRKLLFSRPSCALRVLPSVIRWAPCTKYPMLFAIDRGRVSVIRLIIGFFCRRENVAYLANKGAAVFAFSFSIGRWVAVIHVDTCVQA